MNDESRFHDIQLRCTKRTKCQRCFDNTMWRRSHPTPECWEEDCKYIVTEVE